MACGMISGDCGHSYFASDLERVDRSRHIPSEYERVLKDLSSRKDGLCYGVNENKFSIYSFSDKSPMTLSLDSLQLLVKEGATFYGLLYDESENSLYLQPKKAREVVNTLKDIGIKLPLVNKRLSDMEELKASLGCIEFNDEYERD